MRQGFCLAGIPILLLLATASVFGQKGIHWEKDLDAALARAKDENRPLLICMHTSTEIACKRMLAKVYTDPSVQGKLKEFVLLPTCFDRHPQETQTVDGKEQTVSTLFKTVDCDVLTKNEELVRERFFDGNNVKVPQHIFVGADGKAFLKKIFELKKPAFLEFLDRALVQFGIKEVGGMDEPTRKLFEQVRKGSNKEKEAAVKKILEFQSEKKTEILYLTIQGLKRENDRMTCIRIMGAEDLSHGSTIALKWLSDKSTLLRNGAVVTLEEMKSGEASKPLMDLFGRTKSSEKELKKDILRALGPCGAGDADVKALLVKHTTDKVEINRLAAYLSLGYFLDEEDVQRVMQERWKKEGKSVALKTAIIWGYRQSQSRELAEQLESLMAGERNGQLKFVAAAALRTMRGERAARGTWRALRKSLSVLYAKDKVVRNRVKRWRAR